MPNKKEVLSKITGEGGILNEGILKAVEANEKKNKNLLQNLAEAGLNTIKRQGEDMAKDKEKLSKEAIGLNLSKELLTDELEVLLAENNREKSTEIYNKIADIDKSISGINNQLTLNNETIEKIKADMDELYGILKKISMGEDGSINEEADLRAVTAAKDEIDGISHINKDFMISIVELMIQRYILIEEYKVEKDRGHLVSMNKLRDEISGRDYKINYILSLKILDEESVDIEYHLRLADLIDDKNMKKNYEDKKRLYEQNARNKEKHIQDIIDKAIEFLNVK